MEGREEKENKKVRKSEREEEESEEEDEKDREAERELPNHQSRRIKDLPIRSLSHPLAVLRRGKAKKREEEEMKWFTLFGCF